jgi:hypothetical protein
LQSAVSDDPPNPSAIVDAFFPSFINAKEASSGWLNRIFTTRSQIAKTQIAKKKGEPESKGFLTEPQLNHLTEAYFK